MNTIMKNAAAGTILGGGLLLTAGLGLAHAQPADTPDGLVTVAVGNTAILEAVDAETAATAAGAICGTATSDVAALAEQVDTEGTDQTVCDGLPGGALAITNTVPAAAEAPAAEAPAVTPGGTDDVQLPAEGESGETAPADTAPIG
ncbi:hypothetical protein NIIDNTM18_12000 [Mycolicibacterium litorale]|uniref:Secreted protein n=1 Tax=Mycolicibacterium litorale TaxID=758802 RepID=A0A6S6P174_9MYCO|nr:hypothetical protein [Mycolicibacterium litorale]BCI51922.1 hypothetical protein NIIDNTM18_12000 [Mycolicibacterium litorale]